MEIIKVRDKERIKQSSQANQVDTGIQFNSDFVPTQEIIDQIPLFLQHFEVEDNRDILMRILASLKVPEPYNINAYLFQFIFDESNSSSIKPLIISQVMQFLRSSSFLESFPYEIFSNEECIFHLIQYLSSPDISQKEFAACLLCSIFDHNPQRRFISPQAYEAIFQIILETMDPKLCLVVFSILLYPNDLPLEVIALFEPFLNTLLEIDLNDAGAKGIKIAQVTVLIISLLINAQIPIDEQLIFKCKNKYINSIDEQIISPLLSIIVHAFSPSDEYFDRILQLVGSPNNAEIVNNALRILEFNSSRWDDSQKDRIQNDLLLIFHNRDSEEYHCKFSLYAFKVLFTVGRLPSNDIEFFEQALQLIDIEEYNNLMVVQGIKEMFTRACQQFPDIAKQMSEILKQSKTYDALLQDDNPDVVSVAQEIAAILDAMKSEK